MGTVSKLDYFNRFLLRHLAQSISLSHRKHDGKPPVILIDLKDCLHMLVLKDQIGVILGGHYDRYNKMMRQFLENIHATGAKLVFFMPGRQQSDDLPFFIPKTEETYIESLEILDTLKTKTDLNAFLQEKNRLYSNVRVELPFYYNLKKLVSNFGDFRITYEQHNQEIARYAKQNARDILALITDDINYLAYSATFQFWRANNLNFKEMTCNRYNKDRLYDKLGFHHGAVQMQLLNSINGTIFLPTFVLNDFLNRLAKSNMNRHQCGSIWIVSAYVNRQPPLVIAENKMTYDLKQISRDVFGDDFSREQLNAITNGLVCYDLDFEVQTKRNLSAFLQQCKNENSFIYKLATDDIFIVKDITYMDFRNYKSKSYAEMVIPILMKICGILFKDVFHPRRPKKHKICMKHAHDEPSKVTEEAIIYPLSK